MSPDVPADLAPVASASRRVPEALLRQAGCLDVRAVRRLPEASVSHRELSRRAACPVVPLLPEASSLP
ncbi:hypothetical protein, partial [Bradyrhizobium pachyrhizi]|uniref:hypothetical protein n=1 Tax=Bradyrhizobium pachyrhizi TaxID=280333 RepID=UPI001AEC062C